MNRLSSFLLRLIATLSCSASCQAWVATTAKVSTTSSLALSSSMNSNDSNALLTTEIIGSGRIGSLLAQAGNCRVLGRSDTIDPDNVGAPILICTRNDALAPIVEACPASRREDLVFVQNGYLDNFLASYDLLSNTQALLYLSVPALGADPVDGITTFNPEGLTAATGKHAAALAQRLAQLNLKCNVVAPEAYRPAMYGKLIWISTYMLVGTAEGCASVGQAGLDHANLVQQVIEELVTAVSQAEGIEFPPGTLERLRAYTDVVADFPCGVKEFEWRNQYFYLLRDDTGKELCPTHNALLRKCRDMKKLGFELPA